MVAHVTVSQCWAILPRGLKYGRRHLRSARARVSAPRMLIRRAADFIGALSLALSFSSAQDKDRTKFSATS